MTGFCSSAKTWQIHLPGVYLEACPVLCPVQLDIHSPGSSTAFVCDLEKKSTLKSLLLTVHWFLLAGFGSVKMIWLIQVIASSAKFSICRTLVSRMRWCTEMTVLYPISSVCTLPACRTVSLQLPGTPSPHCINWGVAQASLFPYLLFDQLALSGNLCSFCKGKLTF